MSADGNIIISAYRAYNARDVDAILALMHPEVDWANGWEGGTVHGHAALRDYWRRQWASFNPSVEPQEFTIEVDGRIAAEVHLVVRDLDGRVLSDAMLQHLHRIENGLIVSMEIRE